MATTWLGYVQHRVNYFFVSSSVKITSGQIPKEKDRGTLSPLLIEYNKFYLKLFHQQTFRTVVT